MEFDKLIERFQAKQNIPLSEYTTWRVGGPARYFLTANSAQDLVEIIKIANENNIPYFILGKGANVLIADDGFDGIVILNKSSKVNFSENSIDPFNFEKVVKTRAEVKVPNYKLSFEDIDYDESNLPRRDVTVESGIMISSLFHECCKNGLTGLQWYSGIPATLGGAVYNNIHGGNHLLSEIISSVKAVDKNGDIKILNHDQLELEYDSSIFHKNSDVILEVTLSMYQGDVERAQKTWNEWAVRKKHQPRNSAGSTWKNASLDESTNAGLPTPSAAYIIDQVAHLKGLKFGEAMVSESQSNFIETFNGAKAQDVIDVMKKTRDVVFEKTGITLKPEVFFIGFKNNPLD